MLAEAPSSIAAGRWSEAALRVLHERYIARDLAGTPIESPDHVFWRVAKTIAEVETRFVREGNVTDTDGLASEFYRLMVERKFMPNSPVLANAGKDNGLQWAACFVLPIEDDMHSIFQSLHDAAMIHASGGGVGYAFSRLRPRGSRISRTSGVSSGPLSFLSIYDAATEHVKQGGMRRGANMAVLRVDHPDILAFVDSKRAGGITNFNISVGITDEFMKALAIGGSYALKARPGWPLPDGSRAAGGEAISVLDAGTVWKAICEAAWTTGDPGLFFVDRVNESAANALPALQTIETTNPCWTGDTKVWTLFGPKTFAELAQAGADVPVLTEDDAGALGFRTMRAPRLTKRSSPLVKVLLDDGTELRCSPDHSFFTKDRRKVNASNLRPGDRLASLHQYRANSKGYLKWANGVESPMAHHVVLSWTAGRRPDYPAEHGDHIDENKTNNLPDNLQILPAPVHNARKMLGERNPMAGMWDERNPLFGRPTAGKDNGRYRSDVNDEQLARLSAEGWSLGRIAEHVGCSTYTVAKRLREREALTVSNHKVVSITPLDETEDVYNGTVDETHRYFVLTRDGHAILSANCGEQALPPYAVCTLGHLNLAEFYNEASGVDWSELRSAARLAVRFLDNVVEANPYPLPEVRKQAHLERRIGLGVMGWADLLTKLRIPYASVAALELATRLGTFILDEAKIMSEVLARERGTFDGFGASVYKHSTLRRNANLTTVAPTGTVSMFAGCSSGIEPLFALSFQHRVRESGGFERTLTFVNGEVQTALADDCDAREVPGFIEQLKASGSLHDIVGVPEPLKRVFETAHEIPLEWHVRHQSIWQRFFSESSVSKTINLAKTATVADVERAYTLAWENGCLGITIFRDGCKGEQVLNVGSAQNVPAKIVAVTDAALLSSPSFVAQPVVRPRPAKLSGSTYRTETPNGVAFVTVNEAPDGEPFEVFLSVGKAGSDVMAVSEALGRLVSYVLRLPSALSPRKRLAAVAGQMSRIGGATQTGLGPSRLFSLPDALSRVLSEHLGLDKPAVAATTGHSNGNGKMAADLCPQCGNGTLIYAEGCKKCLSCGHSEC